MSARIQKLISILNPEVIKFSRLQLPMLTWKDIVKKKLEIEILQVYHELGGQYKVPLIAFEGYDIELEGRGLILDEEKNFNRYRTITLKSSLYNQLPAFSQNNYLTYCRMFEKECLKSAGSQKEWVDMQSTDEFGAAGEVGELHKQGSPLWKKRAFMDFLVDITPLVLPIKIFRISIWDNVLINSKMYKVKDILLSSNPALTTALAKNLERRLGVTLPNSPAI